MHACLRRKIHHMDAAGLHRGPCTIRIPTGLRKGTGLADVTGTGAQHPASLWQDRPDPFVHAVVLLLCTEHSLNVKAVLDGMLCRVHQCLRISKTRGAQFLQRTHMRRAAPGFVVIPAIVRTAGRYHLFRKFYICGA